LPSAASFSQRSCDQSTNADACGRVDGGKAACTGRAGKIADTDDQQEPGPADGGERDCPPATHEQAEDDDSGNQG